MAIVTVTDAVNKDEIDLDDLEGSEDDDYVSEEEREKDKEFVLEQMVVPKAVFGSASNELLKKNANKETKF